MTQKFKIEEKSETVLLPNVIMQGTMFDISVNFMDGTGKNLVVIQQWEGWQSASGESKGVILKAAEIDRLIEVLQFIKQMKEV